MRVIPASDYRRMPWKNGVGDERNTVEVAAFDTLLLSQPWRSLSVRSREPVHVFRIDIDEQ
jgi:environmental stress-induced protein Ves